MNKDIKTTKHYDQKSFTETQILIEKRLKLYFRINKQHKRNLVPVQGWF